jgi:hypothetical protein
VDDIEHRDIGEAATGRASVNLGDESGDARFWLGYGDVMALSGDYFTPESSLQIGDDAHAADGALVAGGLFGLARRPGRQGTMAETRDEIVCALKVMTIDEAYVDRRFEAGRRFADYGPGRRGSFDDVERRVRDRYLQLAAPNDDHFVAPGGVTYQRDPGTRRPLGSAVLAYRHPHQVALELARLLGRSRGDLSRAMDREAAAQHFLTMPSRQVICEHRSLRSAGFGARDTRHLGEPATQGGLGHRLDAERSGVAAAGHTRRLPRRSHAVCAQAANEPVSAAVRWEISGHVSFMTATTATALRSTQAAWSSAMATSPRA